MFLCVLCLAMIWLDGWILRLGIYKPLRTCAGSIDKYKIKFNKKIW